MPIYQYKCRTCSETIEVRQSFSENSLTQAPGCTIDETKQHDLKKVFSAVGIAFKGEGFYKNDSGSNKKKPVDTKSPSSDSSSSEPTKQKKTDKSTSEKTSTS